MIPPQKIKVLVAEDDFFITDEVVRIVKKLDYQFIGTASNGIKAVEMALAHKPDVVLMDIKMPKLDGIEAARKMIEGGCEAAIIILSAHESHDLIEKAEESGVAAYLTKPPKMEEIDRAIAFALTRQRDLAESRRLIKELELHKQQLNELNATKDRFFSIIAHDLRSPVSALHAFSEFLQLNFTEISSSDLKHYISVIQSTSKGLFDLLEELFLWASLQSGRYEFCSEQVVIKDVAESVVKLLGANAIRKNIKLIASVNENQSVLCDRNMLQTIIRNLVSNAVKFTPNNGSVNIEVKDSTNETYISINDTGVGISSEDIDRLFRIDEQFTTSGTLGEKGTGLGLVLCKDMVERNNGRIWVESVQGKGSSFTFALPKKPLNE